jgi:hypothetical protein
LDNWFITQSHRDTVGEVNIPLAQDSADPGFAILFEDNKD